MTTDNFCFYLQNRLIQTCQTGGQQYSDTSPFSIPWLNLSILKNPLESNGCEIQEFALSGFISHTSMLSAAYL